MSTCWRVYWLGFFTLIDLPSVVILACEERSKPLSESIVLHCPPDAANCTWFHVVDNVTVPVEGRFLAADNGNVNLLGNDVESYGEFIQYASPTNTSQCYEVCPPDNSVCDNCSNIIIGEMVNPSEVEICIGDDIYMTLQAPPIFSMYSGGSLKRGEKILSCNSKCCAVQGSIATNSVVYQCMNMDVTDSGSYFGHVLISCGQNHVEWCTPNVTIIVRNCSVDPTSATSGMMSTTMSGPTSSLTVLLPLSSSSSASSSSYSLVPSVISPPVTTMSPSSTSNGTMNSNDDGNDGNGVNVGAIVGSTIGAIVVVILIIVLIIAGYCFLLKKPKDKNSIQCTDGNVEFHPT